MKKTKMLKMNYEFRAVLTKGKFYREKQIEMLVEHFIIHNSVGGMIYGCPIGGQGKNIKINTCP